MVAKEALDQQQSLADRSKAAAWAWYQRSAGSAAPIGKSEAFAARSSAPRSPSRFLLEAQSQAAQQLEQQEQQLLLQVAHGDDSARDDAAHSESSAFHRKSVSSSGEECLDLVSLEPGWDCGSSLFDSFELVAMSKQLDSELSNPFAKLPRRHPASDLFSADAASDLWHAQSPRHPQLQPMASPVFGQNEFDHDFLLDIYPYQRPGQEKISDAETTSKQAIYDMFSRYGRDSKETQCDCADGYNVKKQKSKHRISLHSLSKAFQNLSPLAHSGDHQHREHHHHYHSIVPHLRSSSRVRPRISAPSSSLLQRDELGRQQHVHHHHHHHYHYLFHSDDGFRPLQPLDKSLIVAAAGLRTPKMSLLPGYLPFEMSKFDGVEDKRGRDGF